MDYLLLIVGLVILVFGGEATLRGAIGLARLLKLSSAIIGLTVMGFGTSAPEFLVTVKSALQGNVDIGVGNIIGSNIANSLLILGAGALICPLVCDPRAVRRDGVFMLAATLVLCALGLSGTITAWAGGTMFLALCIFLTWTYFHDRRHHDAAAELHEDIGEETQEVPRKSWVIFVYLAVGFGGLSIGADMMVSSAGNIAANAGVPQSIIGLSIVAFGTSLPELGATAIAAWRRHTDIAVANVLGSNIFNIMAVLGVSALFTPLEIAPSIAAVDQWVMLGSIIFLAPVLITDWRVSRLEGLSLLVLYIGYIFSLVLRAPAVA